MEQIMTMQDNCKYVFVCGLQRSGTSVLARNIARLENCTSFKNTGVFQDEGQYLQDVYPADNEYGSTGKFGFDPRAHLTETSALLTPANIAKLRRSWHSHWDKDKSICVEKTPGNLIMTRFLQAAFPNAYFIVIRRHPVAVSMATQKWSLSSLHSLFEHWLGCHDLFEQDRQYLTHVHELTYEDYVENPEKHHSQIADFIGTRPISDKMESLSFAHNRKYLDRWSNLLTKSPWKPYYLYIVSKYEPKFAKYNYSLTKGLGANFERFGGDMESMAARVGLLYCIGANVSTFFWRLHGRKMELITKPIRSILPRALKDRMKRTLQRRPLHWAARLLAPRWFAGIRTNAR
jgi:sulfotransferase family protein